MKKLLILAGLIAPSFLFAQAVTSDPALEVMEVTNNNNGAVVTSQIMLNNVIKLKVPILNKNLNTALPKGTCKIKVGLGSKLSLSPSFNLATVNTSNYFNWVAVSQGGQIQIIGDLVADLPANFLDTATFNLIGFNIGSSTITTNFLVTNHNSPTFLSDENGTNNIAFTPYTILTSILPVTISLISAESINCALNVKFNVDNEINVDKYELELSTGTNNFEKISTINATNNLSYTFNNISLQEVYKLPKLYLRIKSIDLNGSFKYSYSISLSTKCILEDKLILYPNPVTTNVSTVNIENKNSVFNGTYTIQIIDVVGKIINQKEIELNNIKKYSVAVNSLAAGQYFLKVISLKNKEIQTIKFVKQ